VLQDPVIVAAPLEIQLVGVQLPVETDLVHVPFCGCVLSLLLVLPLQVSFTLE
jgi:hypothetical protein